MALRDFQSVTLDDFAGPNQLSDPVDVNPQGALVAQNVSYLPGEVSIPRLGYSQAIAFNDIAVSCFNWLRSDLNWFVYFTGLLVKYVDVTTAISAVTAMTQTAQCAAFANAGSRFYAGFFDQNGNAVAQGQVYNAGLNQGADKLFAAPLQYTPSAPADTATGGMLTAGVKRLAYQIITRNGYQCSPSPVNASNVFQPITVTALGGDYWTWTLNTAWPTFAAYIQILMTTSENLNDWYVVPTGLIAVPGGTSFSVEAVINISDGDLIGAPGAVNADNFFNLFTQTQSGTGPFNVSVPVPYRSRMGYVTNIPDTSGNPSGAIYMSDQNAFQSINAADNLVPQTLFPVITAAELDAQLFIFGPHTTHTTYDNGSLPATWATPALVDGAKGTLAPRGVVLSPSGKYLWVAHQSGLYCFWGSKYPDLPISYNVSPDWNRINWTVAWCLEVVDDATEKVVRVKAALDTNTSPSHILSFDYTAGIQYDQVKYSLDNLAGYPLGSICTVENRLPAMATGVPGRVETWLGPSSAGSILRLNSGLTGDANPYADNGAAISGTYQTAPMPGVQGPVYQIQAIQARMRGNGLVSPVILVLGLDGTLGSTLRQVTLQPSPGLEYLFFIDMRSESATITITNYTVGNSCIISRLKLHYSEWIKHR